MGVLGGITMGTEYWCVITRNGSVGGHHHGNRVLVYWQLGVARGKTLK